MSHSHIISPFLQQQQPHLTSSLSPSPSLLPPSLFNPNLIINNYTLSVTSINDCNLRNLDKSKFTVLIKGQDPILYELIQWFSEKKERWNIIHQLKVTGKLEGNIALRLLDWFIVNYSKSNPVEYINKKTGKMFNVHESYKYNLRIFTKEAFDSVARTNTNKRKHGQNKLPNSSVEFVVKDDESNQFISITSNLRQLNLFKWAIENDILTYLKDHRVEIATDMKETLSNKQKVKKVEARGRIINKKRRLKSKTLILTKVEDGGQIYI